MRKTYNPLSPLAFCMTRFTQISCPICLKKYSPKKWANLPFPNPEKIGTIFESKGRGTMKKIKDMFVQDYKSELGMHLENVIPRLLTSIENLYKLEVITKEQINEYSHRLAYDIGVAFHVDMEAQGCLDLNVQHMKTKRYSEPFNFEIYKKTNGYTDVPFLNPLRK